MRSGAIKKKPRHVQPAPGHGESFNPLSIPVQWNAWLRGTRALPPTPDEIQFATARFDRHQALPKEHTPSVLYPGNGLQANHAALKGFSGAPVLSTPTTTAGGKFKPANWSPT